MYVSAVGSFAVFVFFKQKTAYEMRISDWSSDVCSSDLMPAAFAEGGKHLVHRDLEAVRASPAKRFEGSVADDPVEPRAETRIPAERVDLSDHAPEQIGRASCRERVCPYV